MTKTCRCNIESADDIDGIPFVIHIERFACVEDGRVYVEDARIEIEAGTAYDRTAASLIGETMLRAVDMLTSPTKVA